MKNEKEMSAHYEMNVEADGSVCQTMKKAA